MPKGSYILGKVLTNRHLPFSQKKTQAAITPSKCKKSTCTETILNSSILRHLIGLPRIGILIPQIPWNEYIPPTTSFTAEQTKITYQTSSKFFIFWKKSISWVYLEGKKTKQNKTHSSWLSSEARYQICSHLFRYWGRWSRSQTI